MTIRSIVVIGAGVIGTSTAYYLSTSKARGVDTTITLVEATDVASAASGKSGGFLASDWHGQATASLSALSYDLHAKLAKEHGGDSWGYRQVDTLSVTTDASSKSKKPSPVPWLPEGTVHNSRSLGTTKTTAQVHPGLFTKKLLSLFLEQPRTSFRIASAIGLTLTASKSVASLRVRTQTGGEEDIPADVVVIATGPWTGRVVQDLLGASAGRGLNVTGSRAHSIVVKTEVQLTAHALFTDMTLKDGSAGEPEVYARPDGTTYICGSSDEEPLPPTSSDVTASPSAISALHTLASSLSPVFDTATTIAEQACYLPIPDRGRPLVGKVRSVDGVFIGSGHSCWGITQGPGTGKVLSEMILEGKAMSADVSRLLP